MGVAELHNLRRATGTHAALVASSDHNEVLELVMGRVVSGAGKSVRAGAMLRPERTMRKYSHIGEVPLPAEMLEEFREGQKRFFFYADSGEEFDEIHVIDELKQGGAVTNEGIIVLLRESVVAPVN